MSYLQLADEIITQIVSLIASSDIESFALINSQTYRIAFHRFKEQRALSRNKKTMTARFGPPHRSSGICIGSPVDYHQRSGLLKDKYNAPAEGALADLDYLKLNGDLHWLQPFDEAGPETHLGWPRGKGASKEELDALVASGKRVGVEFPPGFITVMGSTDLIERFFLGGDFFSLGPSLVKCNSDDDSIGYVIRFLSDQQGCGYWALYIAPGGYHCVLFGNDVHCWSCSLYGSPTRIEGHPDRTFDQGILVACQKLDVTQSHPNFEAWLAMRYFDGWCCAIKDKEYPERLMEYVDNFWLKKRSST
jgi:hypothetical protein